MSQPSATVFADYTCWFRAAAGGLLWALASALPGCWAVPPKVLTTPNNPVPVAKYFPSALLAEPIQMREGHAHTTQPFTIKRNNERWTVAIGFVRSDTDRPIEKKLDENYDVCSIRSPGHGIGSASCSRNITPGFNVSWELMQEDGGVVAQSGLDSLHKDSGGTLSANAMTRTLSGFRDQPPGQYRLRVFVLRDARELDFLEPHILIDRPFFSFRAIE